MVRQPGQPVCIGRQREDRQVQAFAVEVAAQDEWCLSAGA